jgi:hypothetical protein
MISAPAIRRFVQHWDSLNESWRFAIIAFLIARTFYAVWSWMILTIQPVAVHYVEIDGRLAVVFLDLYTTKSFSFLRELKGQDLEFKPTSINTAIDLQTNSLWDIHTGLALKGRLKGNSLVTAPEPYIFPYFQATSYPNAWLALWQRFDANWYISIAENGYGSINGDIHFPPLFPLLIRLAKPLLGNAYLAGLLIAHIATLCALKLLMDLFNEWGGAHSGRDVIILFLMYPSSFFLFSAYSESLFLVLALMALRAMNKRSWGWAGFWTFCAILTRLQGVGLLAPMLYLMAKDSPFLRQFHHWAGLVFAGTGFLFYLFLRSTQTLQGTIPFSEPVWHAKLAAPWESYFYAIRMILSNNYNHIDFINWTATTVFIIFLIAGWKKIPVEHNIFASFSLLILLSRIVETQPLSGMLRFSLTIFPVFFTFGSVGNNPWIRRIIVYAFVALNLYLSAEFFGWGWVA